MAEELTEKQVIPCNIAVIGNGPAGMLAAMALSRRVDKVALVGPCNHGQETRTTALMMPAITLLRDLHLWEELQSVAAPLRLMRIIDGTKRLVRSPYVEFHAAEIGESAFGYNIPNQALNAALARAVKQCPKILPVEVLAEHYNLYENYAEIVIAGGQKIRAQLIIAADGRNSQARQAANITVSHWAYPQTALTLIFRHELPHNAVSTEFHTEEGPFTQVPLIGNRSALIWTVRPERARFLLSLGKQALSDEIGGKMGFILGKTEVETMPEAWPMGGMTARQFAARRVALIGETAHLFPPIGAQGLNLTIRDIIDSDRAVGSNTADSGAANVLAAYNRHRRLDIIFRTGFVHGLNRALLSDFLPVQLVRSGGLELLRRHALLRNLFMREGMAPGAGLKKLLPPFLQ